MQLHCACHDTLDFIQAPGFPSAIRAFALTHSRRNVVQRQPWLISVSLIWLWICQGAKGVWDEGLDRSH
jgi:hypothetical protein